MKVALRYSDNIRRDIRRGYSYGEWGLSPFATKQELLDEFPHCTPAYSRELGGWLPREKGLCAVSVGEGENWDEALEDALANARTIDGPDQLWAFECAEVGWDGNGWPVVRPIPGGRRARIE